VSGNKWRDAEILMMLNELSILLKKSVTIGVDNALTTHCPLKDRLNKAEAYRLYGRAQVDRWISEGLFKPFKGQIYISKSGINREKLEAVAAASNRGTYLPVSNR
jgi:hypothetical protein